MVAAERRYNGHIYTSEIARGLDVFELTPTQFLTQDKFDAAKTAEDIFQSSSLKSSCEVRKSPLFAYLKLA